MKNFRERTFVFGWVVWSCVFWWVFAYVFALFLGGSLPKVFRKILLMSGLLFFGVVLFSFGFFRRRRRFSRFFFKRYRSGSNRTPPHALVLFVPFSLFVSRRTCFCPFWPCVPLLAFSSGCLSGPRAFLGFSWYLL